MRKMRVCKYRARKEKKTYIRNGFFHIGGKNEKYKRVV